MKLYVVFTFLLLLYKYIITLSIIAKQNQTIINKILQKIKIRTELQLRDIALYSSINKALENSRPAQVGGQASMGTAFAEGRTRVPRNMNPYESPLSLYTDVHVLSTRNQYWRNLDDL